MLPIIAALAALREREFPAEVRAWLLTFSDFDELEAQVKVGGLAVGRLRSTREFAASEWAKDRHAIIDVDDGAGGLVKTPAPPWLFSRSRLQPATSVARRGEDNAAVLTELGLSEQEIKDLAAAGVLSAGDD